MKICLFIDTYSKSVEDFLNYPNKKMGLFDALGLLIHSDENYYIQATEERKGDETND